MNDEQSLHHAFEALGPTPAQVSRIESRLFADLDALLSRELPSVSLFSEWLGLLTARPVSNTVLIAAAAAMLLFTSPLAALPFALLSRA